MSCYKPIKGFTTPTGVVFSELSRHDIIGRIDLPCGMCIGCRMRRASDWSIRVMHEAQMWPKNCFVTLTYGRGCLPPNGSLEYRDFQLFMKRLRAHFGNDSVRFYMCGEYGEIGGRAHYHACLFNVDFTDREPIGKSGSGALMYDSAVLRRLWGHGNVTVQDLVRETAGYCARYIMKKQLGEDAKTAYCVVGENGETYEREPPFAKMSLKPGIGATWLEKFGRDVYPNDFVVVDGSKLPAPRFYDKMLKRKKDGVLEDLKYARELEGRKHAENNTDERLAVREVVHNARVSKLSRSLE